MEVMNPTKKTWGISHQCSHLLPTKDSLTSIVVDLTMDITFHWYKSHLAMHGTYA